MFTTFRRSSLIFACAATFALVPAAWGQPYTWIGTQSGNWSTAANWSGGNLPVSGATTDLVFNSSLDVGYVATNDLASPFTTRTITINDTSSANSPFGIQLVGPIQMNGTGAALVNNGPSDLYIGPISGTASTWTLASPTTISGTNAGQIRITDQVTGSGSLTINRPSTNIANGLTLFFNSTNNFSGGVTLQAGNLTLGNAAGTNSTPANIGTGPLTIATTGSGLAATGELRANASKDVIVTVPVSINSGATLNQFRSTVIVFGTPVTGGGGVSTGTAIVAPTAGLIFEGASTYGGTTNLTNSTVTVRGTAGALSGTSQIELFRNSTLILDSNSINVDTGNTLGNQVSQDRIPDATPLLYHNAALNMIANAATSTTETIGTLTGDGWNTINLTAQTATGATLTVSNLVRSGRGTFEFRGANLGGAAAGTANTAGAVLTQLNGDVPTAALVGGGGAAGSSNISIIPFMTGGTTAGSAGTTFLTYDTNGLRALSTTTEFVAAPAVGSTNNVRTTVPLVVSGQPVTANSFISGAASAGLWGFGGLTGQLTVTSGAVLSTTATSFLNVGALNFAGKEAVVTGNGTTNINAAVTNNSGLTYSGTSRTGLLSPVSVIGGPVTLNSGTLTVNSQAQLGGATALNLNGGALSFSTLASGAGDTLSTPINVGSAGGAINVLPIGGSTSSASQVLTLTGALTGTGPLLLNAAGAMSGQFLPQTGGGTIVLAGDASGYSGMVVVNAGVVQIDSDARLGTNPLLGLASAANVSQPATLRVTATTATNKNLYMGGLDFIQVDAGATFTINGYISAVASSSFRKFGAGQLLLTNQETFNTQTFIGSPAMTGNVNITSGTGVAAAGTFSGIGGTLTLRDQGALLSTIATTVSAGGTLVLDNTGSANLPNRLNNAPVNLAGGTMVLMGSPSATSSEIAAAATLAANTGSIVEVVPGAGQTAALFFSGPTVTSTSTSGGLVRATTAGGSTLTLRAPGLGGTAAGTGQINFIHNTNGTVTGPTLVGGGTPGTPQTSVLPGVFGEDPASGAIGLTTLDVVAANAATGFPQYYRARLLNTATEYANGSPDAGPATANFRLTAPATSSASPTANALFVDAGGSLAINAGTTVTLTSGTVVMAGGTNITGGTLAAAPDTDLTLYVGAGIATLGSDVATSSSGLPPIARTLAKAGPGTLILTTALGAGGTPPGTLAIQRGTFQLGAGGSLPTTINVSVDAGATFNLNSPGTTVNIARLVGLGNVQLGTVSGTVLRVSPTTNYTPVFGGTITGTGTFEQAGPGVFEFAPSANFTGPITLSGGTLQFGDAAALSVLIPAVSGGAITASDGTTISYFGVQDFQRPINVTVGSGAGTVIFSSGVSATNTQAFTTRISGPITVAANKTLSISDSAGGLYRFSGAISGAGNVTFNSGNSIIDAINTYTGNTTLGTAATFGIGSDSPFGNGTVTISAAPSFYAVGAAHTVPNPITLNADLTYGTANPIYQGFDLSFGGPVTIAANRTVTTTAAGKLTLTAVGGGAFSLTKAGGGTLSLAGTNTYAGTTAVSAGTLLVNGTLLAGGGAVSVASGAFLGGNGVLNRNVTLVAGATVSVNGNNFTIGSLGGAGGTVNDNATAPGTLTVGTDNTSTSFGGTIVDGWTGALALVKVGTGTLSLSGTNTYSGGTTISGGILSVANDASLGTGPVTITPFGTLNYTTTTGTTRSFTLAGGTVAVSAGQTLTLNGSQVSSGYLNGPGTFATGATGAQFANMTIRPSAAVIANSSSDLFLNVNNGGALTVAAGLTGPVTTSGLTNQASGSIMIGAGSVMNAADFQSYGLVNINPAASTPPTLLTNTGTAAMYFSGGSRTFVGTPATAGNNLAGVNLGGQNLVVAGSLFVNNGFVADSIGGGSVIVDFGALYKGAGTNFVPVVTQNGGRVQAGNSPGSMGFGKFVFGPGGVNNYVFAIDDATGAAGPSPDAQGLVSGWGLVKAVKAQYGANTTSGDFLWTATPGNKLTFALDTLVNPTLVGTDVGGPMADFDPDRAYAWPAVRWAGAYSGPADAATLTASTSFDTSGFLNPVAGTFGWALDPVGQTLSLVYTPSAVPEPGTLVLSGIAMAAGLAWYRRRWAKDAAND